MQLNKCNIFIKQLMSSLDCPEGRADIVFLVDRSGSIEKSDPVDGQGTNWEQIKKFMVNFCEDLTIGPNNVQVGSDDWELLLGFTIMTCVDG